MSLKFTVGDLTIHRIIEQETTFLPALEMLPDLTPDLLAKNRPWMQKAGALDANDVLILCFQSYIVKTPHHTILIDSCNRQRQAAAVAPEMGHEDRRHLHARTGGGRLFSGQYRLRDVHTSACRSRRLEYAAARRPLAADVSERTLCVRQDRIRLLDRAERKKTPVPAIVDSVLPIVEDNRSEIVSSDFAIGDHARILPTPGHTPGHVAFTFGRGKDDAVFSGDLMHTPLQARYPEMSMKFDVDPAERRKPARLPGTLLRHRYAVLHRAFPVAVRRKNPPRRQRI